MNQLHNKFARVDGSQAFTLIEMLMVLAIIGLLTGLTLPFLKGLGKTNTMGAAARQLLDDVSYARHKAIAAHTTVYMIFLPPVDVNEAPLYQPLNTPNDPLYQPKQWTKLITGQAISYTFFSRRAIGDQPGEQNANYLTKWFSLPEGTFIPEYKFTNSIQTSDGKPIPQFDFSTSFPVPAITNSGGVVGGKVAYIAFDHMGRLVRENGELLMEGLRIPIAQGSVFFDRNDSGGLVWSKADMRENPPDSSIQNYTLIYIDGLTGRAKIEQVELK